MNPDHAWKRIGPAALVVFVLVLGVPASAVAAEAVLVLDPGASRLAFDFGTTLHGVEGTLHLSEGTVRFDLDGGTATGRIVIDATRTETGNRSRDKKMHNAVLESERYPEIVYRPSAVSGRLAPDGTGRVHVDGTVSIHGSEHPLGFDADVTMDGDRLTATTEFLVPYVEWGMKDPSLFILRVDKEVHVEVAAVGRVDLASDAAEPAHLP